MNVFFNKTLKFSLVLLTFLFAVKAIGIDLKVTDTAPLFTAKTHNGQDFNLQSRQGKWTVLYFYPKADTPGCTQEALTFRDNLDKIQAQGAEVYGISSDSIKDQLAFHQKQKLNFTLLADPDSKVLNLYGTKMPLLNFSKRWTFIIDPDLKIRLILKDVDPVTDTEKIADTLARLKIQKN